MLSLKLISVPYSLTENLLGAMIVLSVSKPQRPAPCHWGSEVKWKSLSCVRPFATPWIYSPWNSQARILEWVAFPFSRGSSQPRDQTQASCIAGGFFTSWATREACHWEAYKKICICAGSYVGQIWEKETQFLPGEVSWRSRGRREWKTCENELGNKYISKYSYLVHR